MSRTSTLAYPDFNDLSRVSPLLNWVVSPFEENVMFKVFRCLSTVDIKADDITGILDSHFYPELVTDGGSGREGTRLLLDETPDEWGKLLKKRLPHPKHERLRYIRKSTTAYSYQNHVARACQRCIWPTFFTPFRGAEF